MTETEDQFAIDVSVDIVILGGGIAGLWTLARLLQAGYKAVLLESKALGAGQTRYAQGIIHGGTKYALTGKLTASSEAVADMPARWRACYEGRGELDLSRAELLSDAHYLWSTSSLTSRISGFFASKVMRSRSAEVEKSSLPSLFQHSSFKGQVYRLDEPVFNTLSIVHALAEPLEKNIFSYNEQSLETFDNCVRVQSKTGENYAFNFSTVLLMAGEANEKLLEKFSCKLPLMQRRPLKMVILRGGLTDRVYAHCLGASVNPRITITTHRDTNGDLVWYMGGQLAEEGVSKTNTGLIQDARAEIKQLIPWLQLKSPQWGVLDINRAEIQKPGTTRPDSFSIETNGNIITAWPTKLALAPALADALLAEISGKDITERSDMDLPDWPAPDYADFPWNEQDNWLDI